MRPESVAYLDWTRDLAARGSISAVRVKIADNEDNSDPARAAAIQTGARMLAERYRPARDMPEARIERGCSS